MAPDEAVVSAFIPALPDVNARERLLTEGMRHFLADGFAEVSTRQICTAAGVTQPSLYHHFGSKEGLYVAVIERWFADIGARVAQAATREHTLTDRLRAVAVIFWSGQVGDFQAMQRDALRNLAREHQRLLYGAIQTAVIEPILAIMHDAIATGELPAHANSQALMSLYWAMVDGVAGLYRRGDSLPPPGENSAPIELFVAGAKALPASALAAWPPSMSGPR